ncbi:SDR family oxidoreductase [Hoyosella sp. YIM 151337]|uniref:SDR family oxidoreductase n=1 Tax=Hoyosella sp. YIM 151337 TaxID=2992742 RepID=UPI002235DCDC|nr:SDR family oxidoreductase [Hoyosella sp. YIM 151337]MCW4355540.1 SDR family oxidoreductase [Hoyosella sp. YIM 151337]
MEESMIEYPGRTSEMPERPQDEMRNYVGRDLLQGQKALITGGDSGIGRAVAVAFAKEGADVAIGYLSEHDDAARTVELIEKEGRQAYRYASDLSQADACRKLVADAAKDLGGITLLVNNAAYQAPVQQFEEITDEQWRHTFALNIDSFFYVTKAALQHIPKGGAIINTSSINGLRGNKQLIDYSATKGAILALTYSLAQSLMDRGIRVNCVAPGPVWTPLIPATFPKDAVESFGEQAPYERAAQPDEIAPSFVFFAANQMSSYYSGEVLAPIGGETLPG